MTETKPPAPIAEDIPVNKAWRIARTVFVRCSAGSPLDADLRALGARWDRDVKALRLSSSKVADVVRLVSGASEGRLSAALDEARARAGRLFNQVRAGRTVFYKTPHGWDLMGPAADLQIGATVAVTKADGATTQVIVTTVTGEKTHDGVAVRTATFIADRPAGNRPDPTTATAGWSKAANRGRRSHPLGEVVEAGDGYTIYEDTFAGGGRVQIWDES